VTGAGSGLPGQPGSTQITAVERIDAHVDFVEELVDRWFPPIQFHSRTRSSAPIRTERS
jgi:hypothetical protein